VAWHPPSKGGNARSRDAITQRLRWTAC